jgi:hypothetical protein
MRKKKDPEPDPDPNPHFRLMDLDPGGQKHADPADPDAQHRDLNRIQTLLPRAKVFHPEN